VHIDAYGTGTSNKQSHRNWESKFNNAHIMLKTTEQTITCAATYNLVNLTKSSIAERITSEVTYKQ